jgi:ribosomal protein S18 acetylase RimI-like enzyme
MTLSMVTFRSADASDAAAVARFGQRLFRETFGPHHRAEVLDAYCGEAFSVERVHEELCDPARETFVAEHGGAIVGYVQLHATTAPECVSGPDPLELLRFYVDSAWHGRGIAQALLVRVVAAAERRGGRTLFLLVWEHNRRAIAFYEKQGFRRVGIVPFILASDRPLDYVMTRELTPVTAAPAEPRDYLAR